MKLKGNLREDHITSLLLTLSLPTMIGMTVQAFYNIVDTFWVGKIDSGEAIAALTICFPIQMIMIAVASGTGIGLTSIISRRLGEKLRDEAINAAEHGIAIVIAYALLTCAFALPNLDGLLHIFGVTETLLGMSRDYISIIIMGSIFLYFAIISGSVIQAEGNSGTPMKSMLSGAIINMILDPIFIFGLGPFPEMGVKGAAIATVIGQLGSVLVNFNYLVNKQSELDLSWKIIRPDLNILAEIYKVGLPSMIMQLVNSLIMVVLNWLLAPFGFRAIGAIGIYFRVESLLFMPVMGLTQGLIPIVGFNYGARELTRMKEAIKMASLVSLIIMSLGFIAFQLMPTALIAIFNNDPRLVETGAEAMRYVSLLLPLVGPSIIMSSTFQAVGKGFTALWISLLRQVILLLPAILIFPRYLGIKGIWLSFPFSDAISVVITFMVLVKYIHNLEHNGFSSLN